MRNFTPEIPVPLSDALKPGAEAAPMALERLFATMRPELLRFAWWLARDRAVAEDVVQEAMLRAWRSRDALKDPAAARGWLLTIVRREHARLYERKRLEIVDLDEVMAAEDTQLAADGDEMVGLRLAMTQLPDDYRIPLVMQVLGGFTTDEIAQELTLSTAAVLTRLFRARNRLRSIYGLLPAPDALDEPAV
ncbi:MAG TPA: sigma-70 family RNA polymerase sigma factor [Steroidobacteraceae bacterium]|nr:sigma-70 family RNA polymerase sigma factor [Steroidobacteraceae bacterium]